MTSSVFLRASGTAGTVCPHEASRPAPAAALRPLLFILSPALHAGEHPNRHQSLGPRSRRAMASFLESRAGVLEFCVIRQAAAMFSASATDVAASDCTASPNLLHSTIFTTHAVCPRPPRQSHSAQGPLPPLSGLVALLLLPLAVLNRD